MASSDSTLVVAVPSLGAFRSLVTLALCASWVVASPSARAEPGTVELRDGGRVRGEITETVRDDHVTVVLPDRTVMVVPWGNVGAVVFERPATDPDAPATTDESFFDLAPPPVAGAASAAPLAASSGEVLPPPPVPVAPQQFVVADPSTQLDAYLRYQRLPRRGLSIAMVVLGGLGIVQTIGYAVDARSSDRDRLGTVINVGVGVAGGVLVGFGIKRLIARNAGLRQLRAEGFLLSSSRAPLAFELDVDLDVARGVVVPRLAMRF